MIYKCFKGNFTGISNTKDLVLSIGKHNFYNFNWLYIKITDIVAINEYDVENEKIGDFYYNKQIKAKNFWRRNSPDIFIPVTEEHYFEGELYEVIVKDFKMDGDNQGYIKKDFIELIFFISKDDLLTKTQIKYLESRLVQLAIDAKTAEIENGTTPSLPTLHEADISDMEYFLDQLKLILPVMGFRFLIASIVKQTEKDSVQEQKKILLKINSNKISANMYINNQGFIVTKGSQAKKNLSTSCTITYRTLRQKLLDTQILKESGEYYEFVEDTIFSSASAASNMILGRNSNGYTEWISERGIPLKELEEN